MWFKEFRLPRRDVGERLNQRLHDFAVLGLLELLLRVGEDLLKVIVGQGNGFQSQQVGDALQKIDLSKKLPI